MKAYILTLGCKVNQYESQAMLEELCRSGFAPAETEEEADVVILNSCTVTAASDQKMRKLLHRARRKNPQALLVLTGCMPQAFPEEAAKLPEPDLVLGTSNRKELVPSVLKALENRRRLLTEMEKEYEGFSKAVKFVCRAQSGLQGIHGPVANLVKTDGRYSLAIEIALGAGLQNIVVDREEDAKAAISYLKQRDAGRATFLPLTAIRGDELHEKGVEKEFGFVGLGSRLVTFDPAYRNIVYNLLGRTVVVEDLDCGIAMASGADAACQVAQLVLLDSDFAAMPKVVAEGRRVINNIQRASALYLVKNILSFFLALITLFAAFPYPFVPIQLTLISALTIGVPSFFLALEPNHDLVKGKFLHNVLRRAFPGGLTAIFVILFAELFVYTFDLTLAELSTICVILMAVNGLMVIYYAPRPLDVKRIVLLAAMSLAMFIAVVFYGEIFSLTALSFAAWLVLIVLVLLVVPIQMGRIPVRGALRIALRSREKNTANLDLPSPTKVDWPMNWKDMQKKAAK